MNRKEFEKLIYDNYGIKAEYPFENDDTTGVFRHESNRKWFAVAMNIPYSKLICGREGRADIVNLKCDMEIASSLWQENGIFPAYHMNKAHWISVLLDGSVDADTVNWLLGISYSLTAKKIKKK